MVCETHPSPLSLDVLYKLTPFYTVCHMASSASCGILTRLNYLAYSKKINNFYYHFFCNKIRGGGVRGEL